MTRMVNVPRTSIFLEVHLVALHDHNACVGLNGVDDGSTELRVSYATAFAGESSGLSRVALNAD